MKFVNDLQLGFLENCEYFERLEHCESLERNVESHDHYLVGICFLFLAFYFLAQVIVLVLLQTEFPK
jgi:hypothetical protein